MVKDSPRLHRERAYFRGAKDYICLPRPIQPMYK